VPKASILNVNNGKVETGYGDRPVMTNIALHSLCNKRVNFKDFGDFKRWYQLDGNTQVFRLHKGEHEMTGSRDVGAARIEAYDKRVMEGGVWHEWTGRYTIVKPSGAAIFQLKNTEHGTTPDPKRPFSWAMQLGMSDNGDIWAVNRYDNKVVIAKNMTGKSFDVKVRDNGSRWEMYLDGELKAASNYSKPKGSTNRFRWGIYVGATVPDSEVMLFVSGAQAK
jgi:hypothetical protein